MSVKPFGCAVCRKGFVSPKYLADHIRRFHEDPKEAQAQTYVKSAKKSAKYIYFPKEKAKKEVLADSSDEETQVQKEVLEIFNETDSKTDIE